MRTLPRVSLVVLCACGSDLPGPAYVAQSSDALAYVGYPPPPARVEFVPMRPASEAVWIDGEWSWQGRRWAWKSGRWIIPPANARFSPWTMVRGDDGTIFHAGGAWRDAEDRTMPDPPVLSAARPDSGQ